MTQNNRNQNKHNALEARIAALEAELAACQKTQQAQHQGDGAPLPTPLTTKAREPGTMPELGMVSSLIQHTLLPTAVFDADMRYVAASAGWLEAYGLQDRDIIGVSHYDLFPEIGEDWKAIHARCLTGVHETRSEDPFPRADGGMDWITWSVYPWYDGEGEIAGLVMSTAVVTEQVLARENERIFRELVESASDGIVMSDLDDTIRYANPAYKTMLGVDADVDLTGQSLKAYASSDLDDLNSTMRREGRWRGVIEQRRVSGDTFPADVTAFAMRDEIGSLTRRAAMYRDISNEQRMLSALTNSSQQLQVIMQSLPVVLFVTDTEGIITLSEGQALPLLGLQAGEVVGRSIFEHYAAKQDVVDNVRRALAGEAITFDMYFADQDLYFQRHFAPLYSDDGRVTGMLGIGYDVTDRKRTEMTLKDTELRLRTLIANLPGVLFSVDAQGIYTLFEGKGLADLGRTPGDVVGESLFERYPDDDELLAKVRATLAGEHIVYESYAENVDQHFENIYTPLRHDDGSLAGMLGLAVNITDRKRAEGNVDAWKRRYDLIVASSGQVVYEYDVATGDITWSGSVKRVLGFDVADMAGGIDRWMALIHPADEGRTVRALEQAEASASAYNIEYRFKNARGNYIPMVDRGFFLTDDSGIAVTMLGMMQDISERKRAEKDLQLFRTLVASATDGILLTNADGTIAYNNDAYGQLLGLDQADFDNDLLGELAEVSLSDNGKATLVEAVGDILTTGRWQGFIEHQHKQGYAIPTLMTSFAINDEATGELQYVANIIKDITAQQEAQDRLVESERRLQILVANLPVILFATDKDGIATLSEGKALRDIGLQAGEIVGLSIFDHYQDMPVIVEHAKRALAGEASTFEVYYPKADQYFERYFAPLRDDAGNVTGMLGIGYNITERKRASQALEAERKRVLSLYQAVPDTIIRLHKDGTFLDYKPSSYFTSYIDPATTIGQNMRDNVAPEVVEQAFASLEAAIDTGEMQKFENVLEINGETRYRENRFVKLNDQEAIAIVRDVTDLRRAEREIAASQQRLQTILASLPVIVFTLDKDGIFTLSEGKGLEVLGLQPGQVVGMSFFELYANETRIIDQVRRAFAGEVVRFDDYTEETDSYFEQYYTPLYADGERSGEVTGILGVVYNTSDIMRARRNLEKAEKVAKLGNFTFDVAAGAATASGQLFEIYRLPPASSIDLSAIEPFVPAAEYARVQQAFAETLSQGTVQVVEYSMNFADGETRYFYSVWEPIFDESNNVVQVFGTVQDISERKRAENALRESRRLLEDAQRIGRIGAWTFDVVKQELTWSKQVYEQFGVDPNTALTLDFAVSFYVDVDPLQAAMARAIDHAEPYELELEITTTSGERRWVVSIGNPVIKNDQVVRLTGIQQDITERKQAENALRESQQQLERAQRVANFGNFAISVVDMGITASAHALDMHELPQDAPLSLSDLVPLMSEADFAKVRATIEQSVANAREASVVYTLQLPSGIHRDIHAIWQTLQNDRGEVYQIFGTVQDITRQKRAETALLENQRLLEDAQRIGQMGSWSLEVATGDITWSKQTYALLDIDESQPLSLELVMSTYVDPDVLQTAVERAINHAEPYDTEAEVITGSGKHRWVRVMGNPIVQDAQVVRITGIIQDISDIKQAEAELQTANSHLARINHIGSRLQGETSLVGMLEAVLEPLDDPANAMIFYAHNDSDDPHTMTAIELATCYRDTMIPLGTTFQLADYPWTQMYLDNPHETFIVTNVYKDARINELAHPVFAEFNFTTLIIVPLVQGNTWTGIFQMGWAEERQLTAGELAYFKALPTLLAPSITNRRLLDSLEQTISERTRALQDQLTETARFKSIIEATADLVSYGDLDGNVLYLNPAGKQMLGYDQHDGRYLPNVSDVYDDAGNERFALEVMPAVLETGLWRGEAEVIGADGQMIPVSQVVNTIPDEEGHIVGIGTLVRDISESKRIEKALRESEQQLELFFSQSLTGFFFMMLDSPVSWHDASDKAPLIDYVLDHMRITKANQAFLDQYDQHEGNMVGLTMRDMFAHDITQGREAIRALFDAGHLQTETSERRADGSDVFINGDYVCLHNDEGAIIGHVGVQQDVTAKKLAEQQLQTSIRQLTRLSALSQAVNRATSKQELLELIGEVAFAEGAAGIVLHDVDNQTMTNQRPEAMIVSASLTAAGSSDPAFPTGSSIRLADFQATRLFIQDTNNNLYISDAQNDSRYDDASKQLFATIGSHAQVTVPLLQGNRWIGMIGIYWHEVHDYREDEKQLYDALRTLVPPVLANLNIVADLENLVEARSSELRASNERLARLNRLSSRLQSARSLEGILDMVIEPLADDPMVGLLYPHYRHTSDALDGAPEVESLEFVAERSSSGRSSGVSAGAMFPADHYPATKLWFTDPSRVLLISDVANDSRLNAELKSMYAQLGLASFAFITLRHADEDIALLGINWPSQHDFDDDERSYLQALPSLLAPVVANRRLLNSLEQTIDQRTQALRAQLAETTRFKALIETTTDAVGYADMDGTLRYLNAAGLHLFGEDALEVYHNTAEMFDQEDGQFVREILPSLQTRGVWQGEVIAKHTNGKHIPASEVLTVIHNQDGVPVTIGAIIRDITESKALEDNLKRSNAQLTRLSELSQAFNRVTSKQALLEIAAMLAFDEGSSAATLFDLDGQEHTGGTPETMTIAARSRADGKVDDIPVGMTFTLAEFASAELWLDYPDQLLCVENIFEDDRIDDETRRVLVETANTQAYVVVPLLQNNRWVGTFNFTWNEPHVFLDRELQLYEALMTLVPPVLANLNIVADLEDLVAARSSELRASNEQLALINRISNELKAASSSDMMLEVLLEPLERSASASLFYAVTDDQGEMTAIKLVARRSPLTEPPLGTVFQTGNFPSMHLVLDNPNRPLIVADVMQDARLDAMAKGLYQQLGIAATVTIPLQQSQEWIGMLFITYPQVMAFTDNEAAYFSALAAMLAPPLANRRMVENLEDTVAQRSEELSRSRQLLRATIDNAPLVISVKDINLRYILANRNIHMVIPGATPRDVIGRKDSDLTDLVPAWKIQDVQARDLDILANKQVLNYETEREVNGEQRAFSVTKFPMLDENGDLFAIGTIATDITEQKQTDAEMQAYRDQLAKAETELQITQRIQELLLPASHELQAIEDLDIASYMQPAEQVGGDYYDVLHIGDRVKIGIGDVTGHGLESGLLMLMTQTAVRTLLSSDEHDSKRVMDILNRTVFANLQRMQVDKSLTLSLLDYNQGRLSLSGQHEHVLIMRAGGSVEAIDTIDLGMPLGLEEDITRFIAEHVVHLQPGEGVVLFTDGITEAENDAREQFGLPRLIDLVGQHWAKPAEAIVLEIINAVYDHIAAHEVYDDITLIVFKRPLATDASKGQKALVK